MFTFLMEQPRYDHMGVKKDEVSQVVSVVIKDDGVCISDLLEYFGCFLKGCGYSYNGTIDIVEEDGEITSD